ncbi:MAG TPA: hypothetical protein VE955_03745 [Candidatus Dormibacteraeota bacterium]|nr:hypothetical protein [Candidatus Dormibacteraeota bacterium]
MPKSFEIEQSYYFKSAPTKVFQGLTDPKMLEKGFLSEASLVPEKGGKLLF